MSAAAWRRAFNCPLRCGAYSPPQPCNAITTPRGGCLSGWNTRALVGVPSRLLKLTSSAHAAPARVATARATHNVTPGAGFIASGPLGHPGLHGLQRPGELARVGAASHRHVGLAAALAADL